MPLYEYRCSACGAFDLLAGRDDYAIACPRCGDTADRNPVPSSTGGIIIRGGPNQPMPPRGDRAAINEEMHKEVRKRGWTTERTVEEMRKNMSIDERGKRSIDMTKMTQEAP